jgi:hypothetical protein
MADSGGEEFDGHRYPKDIRPGKGIGGAMVIIDVSGRSTFMHNVTFEQSQSAEVLNTETALDDLLQSAQAGSHSAFEVLQRKYSRRLFKQIVAITRNREDAEDVLQETFCKAYVALPLFERRCHVYTWLSRIAINN